MDRLIFANTCSSIKFIQKNDVFHYRKPFICFQFVFFFSFLGGGEDIRSSWSAVNLRKEIETIKITVAIDFTWREIFRNFVSHNCIINTLIYSFLHKAFLFGRGGKKIKKITVDFTFLVLKWYKNNLRHYKSDIFGGVMFAFINDMAFSIFMILMLRVFLSVLFSFF